MSAPLYFTRARLRHDAPVGALRQLLVPETEDSRTVAGHRLVWSLFADTGDRTRDFLWREAEPGLFYILSRRVPENRTGLFEIAAPRAFCPNFCAGDRLGFALRANATKSGPGKGERGARHDVVMDAVHGVARGHRAEARREAIQSAGRAWLLAQGARHGFSFERGRDGDEGDVRITGYRVVRLTRPREKRASLGILDFEGVLRVDDPSTFVSALAAGFGRAKAFGCGLMLVRRL